MEHIDPCLASITNDVYPHPNLSNIPQCLEEVGVGVEEGEEALAAAEEVLAEARRYPPWA